jgi:ribosomal protein S1
MTRPTHSIDEAGWADFVARHGVGDALDGDVVSVVPFGAFIRIGPGVDGLAPQSLWPTLPEAGSRIPVRIAAIDTEHRRVALGPA